jgi:hypothetical protein
VLSQLQRVIDNPRFLLAGRKVHVLPPVTGTTGRPLPRPGRVKRQRAPTDAHAAVPILVSGDTESGAPVLRQSACDRSTILARARLRPCKPSLSRCAILHQVANRRIRHHPPANSDSCSTGTDVLQR